MRNCLLKNNLFVKNVFHEKLLQELQTDLNRKMLPFFKSRTLCLKGKIRKKNCRFEIVANMSRTCYKEIHKCLQSSPTKSKWCQP